VADRADASIIFDTKFDANNFDRGLENMDKAFVDMKKTLVDVASASESAFGGKQQAQVDKFTQKLNRQLEAVQKQRNHVLDLANQYEKLSSGQTTPKSLVDMEKQLTKNESELVKLNKEFDELIAKQEMLEQHRAADIASSGSVSPTTSAELADIDAKLEELGLKIRSVDDSSRLLQTNIQQIRLDPTTSIEAQRLEASISEASGRLERMSSEASTTENALLQAFNTENPDRWNLSAKRINGTLRNMASAVAGVGRDTKKTTGLLEKMGRRITRMVQTVLVFNLIRKSLTNLRNYIGGLIRTNEEFMHSLDEIKIRLAVAFQPIYEAILPALNALMHALSQAAAYLAAFISLIFGKSYLQSAASAKALNEQAEALKKTGGAAKDAGKFLAKFDDINQAAADTASGGAGTGDAFSDLFDNVKEPEIDMAWLEEFRRKLLEIVPDEDYFYNLGKGISDKIAKGLFGINWDKIQDWSYSFGIKLGAFLSGALANPDLWIAAGYTIAQGLNTAFLFALGFARTFDWAGLGQSIAAGINSFFSTFSWSTAGTTVSTFILGLLTTLLEAIRGVNWGLVGESIKEFLLAIDWLGIINAMFLIFGAAFGAIYDFLSGLFGEPVAAMLMGIATALLAYYAIVNLPTIINGVAAAFKFLQIVISSGAGFVMLGVALATFVALNDLSPELTVALGILAGALTALGTAMLIGFGPVGWAIGILAGLGAAAIAMSKVLGAEVIPDVERFGDSISEATQKALTPFIDKADQVREALTEMFLEGGPIVRDNTLAISGYFRDMADSAISDLERMKRESIANLAAIFGDEAVQYEERIATVNKFYDDAIAQINRQSTTLENAVRQAALDYGTESSEYAASVAAFEQYSDEKIAKFEEIQIAREAELVSLQQNAGAELQIYIDNKDQIIEQYNERELGILDAQNRINDQLRTHLEEGGTMEDEHYRALLLANEEFLSSVIDATVENDAERASLAETRATDLETIDKRHAADTLAAAAQHKKDIIKEATEQMNGQIKEAQRLKEAGQITDGEYQLMVAAAIQQRKDIISEEETKYNELVAKTTSGWEGIDGEIDLQTGKVFTRLSKWWDGVKTAWSDFWKGMTGEASSGASDTSDALVDGLGKGLDDNKGQIASNYASMLDGMVAAGDEAMGIHSPADITIEQGTNLVEGLLLAFDDGLPLVEGAVLQMMGIIRSTVDSTSPGIIGQFTNLYNIVIGKTETFTNSMVRSVYNMCQQIAMMLAMLEPPIFLSIPSPVPIAIPRLAQGGLIPPNKPRQVVVGDNTREEEIVSPRSAMREEATAAIKDVLAELGGVGALGGQAPIELTIEFEGRTLGKVLVPLLDKQRRLSGDRISAKAVTV